MGDATLPLLGAGSADELFGWHRGEPVLRARFLAEVRALAERLPAAQHAINLCDERYSFTVAFCAVLLRGQTSLLPPNRSPQVVAEVAAGHANCYLIGEGEAGDSGLPWIDASAGLGAIDASVSGETATPEIAIDLLAAIPFTSGSTGQPAPHPKDWRALTAIADGHHHHLSQQAPHCSGLVATVPPQHMYGLETSVMLPLRSGIPLWGGRPMFPEDIRQALTACGPAPLLITTPVHLRVLVRAALAMPPCALVLSATAPLDAELAAAAEALLGCPGHEVYGSTETGGMAGRRTTAGAAWTPYPGIRLSQAADQVTLAHAGYLATPTPLGDLIEPLDGGRFELHGRLGDMLKIAGKRASLGDLNHRLLAIDGVQDGALFLPDEQPAAGEVQRLGAIVVAPTLTQSTLLEALREGIDPAFLPRRVLFVDDLPRNSTGKLQRADLLACWRGCHGKNAE